jgi:hypothetical protein
MKKLLHSLIRLLSSFGFACILLLLLLLLTYLGTLEQVEFGLYDVQKKYFESMFLMHSIGPLQVPLPGVYLLLILLFLNLLIGGLIRLRKTWSRAGILITHIGIVVMLAAGFVKLRYSVDGHLTLYPEEQSGEFESYYEWEIAIAEVTDQEGVQEYVIPGRDFLFLNKGQRRTFEHPDLPFQLHLVQYLRNCRPMAKGPMFTAPTPVVDGVFLDPKQPDMEAERNLAGAYVLAEEKQGGGKHQGILWGVNVHPWTVPIGERTWAVDLRRKRWELPFDIRLDQFTRELHPHTSTPKVFLSDVTKFEEDHSQKIKITMNEPLRHGGYTLYQASWGPQNARPGERLYSTLAVVRNPSDQWPLYSCIIIALGLLLHFVQKLMKHVRTQNQRRSA